MWVIGTRHFISSSRLLRGVSRWEDAGATGLWVDERSVSPVIATVLMVAIVLVIAASIGAVGFGFTDRLGETTVAAGEDQCVIESIEFDPNDVSEFANDRLASACVIWYDASQTSYNDGDSVDFWEDQSANGFDMTDSAVASESPTWRTNVGGLEAVTFDQSNSEGLSTTVNTSETDIVGDTTISTTALVYVKPGESTIFQVGRPVSGNNEYFRFGYNDANPSVPWYVFADIDEAPCCQFYGHEPNNASSIGQWMVVSYVHDGTEVQSYVNGVSQGGQDGRLDVSDGSIHIGYEISTTGDQNYFEGSLAELVVFEKALTDDEREAIECGMDRKHGSAVSVSGCN